MSDILRIADEAEELFTPSGSSMGADRERTQRGIDFLPGMLVDAVKALSEAVPQDAKFIQLTRPDGEESVVGERIRTIFIPFHPGNGCSLYRLDVLYE